MKGVDSREGHDPARLRDGLHGPRDVVNADARFAEGSPEGLVGWEWMVDHCHLSPGAQAALLRDMADEVADMREAL